MTPNVTKGTGISGAIKYAMGEGNDPVTGEHKKLAPSQKSRAHVLGGQNFGFSIETAADVELARRMLEWMAMPENQSGRTRKCEKDCLHVSLSWHRGYKPDRDEMIKAAQEALKAIGMDEARALFISHSDKAHQHLHIVASRINPVTGKTFKDRMDKTILQTWALRWEREHNQIAPARRELHAIVDAIEARDVEQTIDRLTKRESVFSRHDLEKYLIYGGMDKAEREEFRAQILAHERIVPLRDTSSTTKYVPERLANGDTHAVPVRQTTVGAVTHFTTREILAAERAMLRDARLLADDLNHGLSTSRAEQMADKYDLDAEQRAALEHAGGLSGFAMINGQAGTGKSRVLTALARGYEAEGYDVIGLAGTNQVVADMRKAGYRHTSTIDAELYRLDAHRSTWNHNTVLVVEEAAMLPTEKLALLFDKAHEAQAKIVLCGDPRQLGSIDKGGMFEVLQREHGAAVLRDVKRVQDQDQKHAFNAMHDRNFQAALKVFEDQKAIHWSKTQHQAQQALAERYMSDHAHDPNKSRFVFAYTKDLTDQLNEQIRAFRRSRHELGPDQILPTKHGDQVMATNDRIQFTGNARSKEQKDAGLVNGYAGIIQSIETDRTSKTRITVELDHAKGKDANRVSFTLGSNYSAGEFDAIKLGYAGTIYRGQGRTLDQSYLCHSAHWREASGYVALTRHKETASIFVSTDVVKNQSQLAKQLSRTEHKRAANSYHIDDSTLRYATGQTKQPEKVFAYDPQLGSRLVEPAPTRSAQQPQAEATRKQPHTEPSRTSNITAKATRDAHAIMSAQRTASAGLRGVASVLGNLFSGFAAVFEGLFEAPEAREEKRAEQKAYDAVAPSKQEIQEEICQERVMVDEQALAQARQSYLLKYGTEIIPAHERNQENERTR